MSNHQLTITNTSVDLEESIKYFNIVVKNNISCIKDIIYNFYINQETDFKEARNYIVICMFSISQCICKIFDIYKENKGFENTSRYVSKMKEVYMIVYLMKLINCKNEGNEAFMIDIINDLKLKPELKTIGDIKIYMQNECGIILENYFEDVERIILE